MNVRSKRAAKALVVRGSVSSAVSTQTADDGSHRMLARRTDRAARRLDPAPSDRPGGGGYGLQYAPPRNICPSPNSKRSVTTQGMRMKTMTLTAMAALLCGCATAGPGGATRGTSTSSTTPPKPAHCAFDTPPSPGPCIGGCPAQAGDISDPQYHTRYHSCVHMCTAQAATWSPRPECR